MTRVAIVTGAGRGIGAATAVALARRGVRVALAARTGRELERTASAVRGEGGTALAVTCDLGQLADVERLVVETTRQLGSPDILINNAGLGEGAPLERTDDDQWDRHLRVNLTAPFWLCRALGPKMAARGWGRIVNVASVAIERGLPGTSAYASSKAGLVGLTRALAAELGPKGVTVNAVCPGWVVTQMAEATVDRIASRTGRVPDDVRTDLLARTGQGRFLAADEVAGAVAYLTSDEAAGVNGHTLTIDGSHACPT